MSTGNTAGCSVGDWQSGTRTGRHTGSQAPRRTVTGRKLAEQQLIYDAFHDHLTGLPNRALFLDRLNETLKRGKRYKDTEFALLFLDLDRFKIINDSLGHLAGDELLKAMARRLEACVRTVDTVARFGGDEFAVLLSELHQPADAVLVAGRIQKKLEEPFTISGQQIFSSASVGIVLACSEYQQPDEMLRDADTAMYRAKIRAKGSCEVFNGDMLASARSVLQLENEMRNAIPRQEFCLFYQPIISLQSGKIEGFEALLRWKHPERGCCLPRSSSRSLKTRTCWFRLDGKCCAWRATRCEPGTRTSRTGRNSH